MSSNDKVLIALQEYKEVVNKVLVGSAKIYNTLTECIQHLQDGKDVGSMNTLWGMTDLAVEVNKASRYEGRLWEQIEIAFPIKD